ncbi:type II toxin-antitoxin system RelE/ParE family toxin [bacterium]|nr:type II toxin-antitoxin system RelE/ParE family toxin [bacterium]
MSSCKPVLFIGSSKRDLKEFPLEVKREVGHALQWVQRGHKPPSAKPLKGATFKGSGVLEIVEDHDGDTFRAVYTVRFPKVVYVLHCFQKKSKKGISTPKQDIERVKSRLRMAEEDYKNRIRVKD